MIPIFEMDERLVSGSFSSRSESAPPLPHGLEDEVLEVITSEKGDVDSSGTGSKTTRGKVDVQALPTKGYLDETVIPILLMALRQLDARRPPDPIAHLAAYLMANKEKYKAVDIQDNLQKDQQEGLLNDDSEKEKSDMAHENSTS